AHRVRKNPLMANPVWLLELLGCPGWLRSELAFIHAAFCGLRCKVADRRRAFLRDQRAVLIAMDGVTALKKCRTRELGGLDLVVVEAPFLEKLIARTDAIAVEPPFLTTENQVRTCDFSHTGRLHPV